MIYIRCDGNKDIALGHVQRCLSIADALKGLSRAPVFVTAGEESFEIIKGRGFECLLLNTDYRDMEGELPSLLERVDTCPGEGAKESLILVDSYQATRTYMEGLSKYFRVAWIDDFGREALPADILINYDIHGPDVPYERLYEEAGIGLPERILTGCGYAPLRAEFRGSGGSKSGGSKSGGSKSGGSKAGKSAAGSTPSILITTGGGDKERVLARLPKYLGGIDAVFNLVVGPFFEADELEELTELSQNDPRFVLKRNVSSMAELMSAADLAVSAAGSTVYELCAMGVPTVIFTFAENQRPMAKALRAKAGFFHAGDVELEGESALYEISKGLRALIDSQERAHKLKRVMRELTDGRGAERIALALIG